MCVHYTILQQDTLYLHLQNLKVKNNDLVLDNQVLNITPQGHLSQIIN